MCITDNLTMIIQNALFSKVSELFLVHLIIKNSHGTLLWHGTIGESLIMEVTGAILVLVKVLY